MTRWRWISVGLAISVAAASSYVLYDRTWTRLSPAQIPQVHTRMPSVSEVARAIERLDVHRAAKLLTEASKSRSDLTLLRARLALTTGDCDTALALTSATEGKPKTSEIATAAAGCARATAGAAVVHDRQRGIWIRFQDDADRVLEPLLSDVAVRARDVIGADLGEQLPRPLRIEVVSDLMSLSAITGLPLEAAETTGTVAIARWGRVTMLSPRAMDDGYPWQDTLAHEIAHLVITRASADRAPLWLQEGLAKREESRWRPARSLDETPDPHAMARDALVSGDFIRFDQLGPSFAMLPTPKAAMTAYAEVADFLEYWLQHCKIAALRLVLKDLGAQVEPDIDQALVSSTGYPLAIWISRWQSDLLRDVGSRAKLAVREPNSVSMATGHRRGLDLLRSARLGQLLHDQRDWQAAVDLLVPVVAAMPRQPEPRWITAHAQDELSDTAAALDTLGNVEQLSHLHGVWLAVRGRLLSESRREREAGRLFDEALGFAPTLERVACEGTARNDQPSGAPPPPLPTDPLRRRLCQAARAQGRDRP